MSSEEIAPDPWENGDIPEGWVEGAVLFPLGLEHPASEASFRSAMEEMSAKYGEANVWPDMIEAEGSIYPGIRVRKPFDATDDAINRAWGRIFFSDED